MTRPVNCTQIFFAEKPRRGARSTSRKSKYSLRNMRVPLGYALQALMHKTAHYYTNQPVPFGNGFLRARDEVVLAEYFGGRGGGHADLGGDHPGGPGRPARPPR